VKVVQWPPEHANGKWSELEPQWSAPNAFRAVMTQLCSHARAVERSLPSAPALIEVTDRSVAVPECVVRGHEPSPGDHLGHRNHVPEPGPKRRHDIEQEPTQGFCTDHS
jgi:hypothetical protein